MRLAWLLLLGVALPAAADELKGSTRGQQVFRYWCQSCHGQGTDKPGTVALQVKYKGQLPAALEERRDLTPALVKQAVRRGVSVMPFFRKTEISDEDLQALAAYLAHSL
jgi:mono/diheme cytochrome c family protein